MHTHLSPTLSPTASSLGAASSGPGPVTVATLLVGSHAWAAAPLHAVAARPADLPLPAADAAAEPAALDVEALARLAADPSGAANAAGGRSSWRDTDGDGAPDVGGDVLPAQGHSHALVKLQQPLCPVYYAPRRLLPLAADADAEAAPDAAAGARAAVHGYPLAAVDTASRADFGSGTLHPPHPAPICPISAPTSPHLTIHPILPPTQPPPPKGSPSAPPRSRSSSSRTARRPPRGPRRPSPSVRLHTPAPPAPAPPALTPPAPSPLARGLPFRALGRRAGQSLTPHTHAHLRRSLPLTRPAHRSSCTCT
jgi:hypothetical protein